jgi:cell wall-associated NlpC family hydrolase
MFICNAQDMLKAMSAFNKCIKEAISWALSKLDSTEYKFKCLGFVEDAYEKGAKMEFAGYYSAAEAAEKLNAGRNIDVPPLGAFVFYDCWGTLKGKHRNWGHVGLSAGDGKVIHAWDKVRVDNYLDVQNLPAAEGWTRPQYVGWIPLEEYPRARKQGK